MDFVNHRPIYEQIIEDFKKKLVRGEIKPGDKICSQRELAQQVKVNPNTVQRAYREMEILGLTETLRGQGTFIVKDEKMVETFRKEMVEAAIKDFIVHMRELGYPDESLLEQIKKELMEGKNG